MARCNCMELCQLSVIGHCREMQSPCSLFYQGISSDFEEQQQLA